MTSEPDLYAKIQQHLQHGSSSHGDFPPTVFRAENGRPMSVARTRPYQDVDDLVVSHPSSDEAFDRNRFYCLKNASDYASSISLHEPAHLLPVNSSHRDTVAVPMYEDTRKPYDWGMSETDLPLKYAENDLDESHHWQTQHPIYPDHLTASRTHLMGSADEKPYDWGMSETDLPLKYAENDLDESHHWQTQHPIYPDHLTASRTHLMGSADESLEMPSQKEGKFTWSNQDKLKQKIDERERGVGRQRYPFVTWLISFGVVVVFIAELILSKQRTGEAVQVHPSVQPMIGPPAEFLISFGARFAPCMRNVPGLPPTNMIPCLNHTATRETRFQRDELCSLADICGLKDATDPNQGYRFVSAIFVHAGIVHILFNLIVLLTLCGQIEKLIGSLAYAIVFMAGGIGGNLLGGNFGLIGQPALGASGAVYTCISFEMIDLIYNWKFEMKPKTRLTVSIIFAIIGLALGLLPGLDNFSHIGGFCIGILGGLVFAPSIHPSRSHMIINWVCRLVGVILLIAFLVALVLNFYRSDDPSKACTWCRYLSCLPAFDACRGGGIYTTTPDGEVTQ